MFWDGLVAAAFPTLCPCGSPGDPVCPSCARTLRVAPKLPPPAGVDDWVAPFSYEGVARELVARVKYRDARATVPWLASAMADAVAARYVPSGFDAVTWAPTVADRRRRRGFDHAELLAREVAGALGLPVRCTLIRRPGPPQTGLPRAARHAGPALVARAPVSGRLLVIDDVATTGATLGAAARALRSAGAESVIAVTAARTPAFRTRSA